MPLDSSFWNITETVSRIYTRDRFSLREGRLLEGSIGRRLSSFACLGRVE